MQKQLSVLSTYRYTLQIYVHIKKWINIQQDTAESPLKWIISMILPVKLNKYKSGILEVNGKIFY